LIKIAVIGTINKDTVRLADGSIKRGFGGILYNLAALSHLLGDQVQIIPVCNIGRNDYGDIIRILKSLPGVQLEAISKVGERNNHCFLTYSNMGDKKEILKGGVPSLRYKNIAAVLDADLVLVNYISGRDVGLRALKKFAGLFRGRIYIDIHSLTLGKHKDGSRYLRRPSRWEKIFRLAHYIQMNRLELSILSGGLKKHRGMTLRSELKLLYEKLKKGGAAFAGKYFLVTDGENGCYLALAKGKKMTLRQVKPKKVYHRGDTTGCGDCFSAGFIAGLYHKYPPAKCVNLGNAVAADRIEGAGIPRLMTAE
jgi:sugar/nucleoside kinase (ribokinase family)